MSSDPRVPVAIRESVPHRSQLFVPIVARDQFIGPRQSRMRHHSQTARLMNQFDCLLRGHFELWHPGWFAFFEEALKSFIDAAAFANSASKYRP